MAKFKKEADFTYSIEEFIAPLKESEKHDWVKGVARIKWGNNPTTLDIRNINLGDNSPKKGISLSDEEADTLTNILLDEGYGTVESIKAALDKRKSIYTVSTVKNLGDDSVINIDINI